MIESTYIPVLIFLAGIADVAVATARVLMLTAGFRWQAAVLATVQITIFVTAISAVAANLENPFAIGGYALGWGAGTWISMWVDERIGMGFRLVQVINRNPDVDVAAYLRAAGDRVTQLRGRGMGGEVEVLLMVVRRRTLASLVRRVEEIAPQAFITVERAERAAGGSFPEGVPRRWPWMRA